MSADNPKKLRIGAVRYLNSKPLVQSLPRLAPQAVVIYDLPSRLADGVAAGHLDVALLPSIECFRHRDYTIVSDACIAGEGPVQSVKVFSRVRVERITSLAVDVGSRTSAALAQIVFRERFGTTPVVEPLPIGARMATLAADAVMLIGDRCLQAPPANYCEVMDLGAVWSQWTGLPFVFAMWIARPDVDLAGLPEIFAAARDEGLTQIEAIAAQEAPRLGLPVDDCLVYLRDVLKFHLGPRQREGLERFYQLAVESQLAPPGVDLVFYPPTP